LNVTVIDNEDGERDASEHDSEAEEQEREAVGGEQEGVIEKVEVEQRVLDGDGLNEVE
jgi:hypothetical protein